MTSNSKRVLCWRDLRRQTANASLKTAFCYSNKNCHAELFKRERHVKMGEFFCFATNSDAYLSLKDWIRIRVVLSPLPQTS